MEAGKPLGFFGKLRLGTRGDRSPPWHCEHYSGFLPWR